MRLLDKLGKVVQHYDRAADILEIEFGDGVLRDSTIAYEDVILIHLGIKPGIGGKLLQGVTIIGYQEIRQRIHGLAAGEPAESAEHAKELLENLEVEFRGQEGALVLKDHRYWDRTEFRLVQQVGPHTSVVRDPDGKLIGLTLRNPDGVDLGEFLDILFSAILPCEEDRSDPMRLAVGRELAVRWLAPLLQAA
jgi:hypothetical protein